MKIQIHKPEILQIFSQRTINKHEKRFISRAAQWKLICCVAIVVLLVAAVFWYNEWNSIYHQCYAEAGINISASDFIKKGYEQVQFSEDSETINTAVPGKYLVKIRTKWMTHSCVLTINDTIAPKAQTKPVCLQMNEECEADAFIAKITDATHVDVAYLEEPDFKKGGSQQVKICLTDLGQNNTIVEEELFISQVRDCVTLEIGEGIPKLSDFVIEAKEAEFVIDISRFKYDKPTQRNVQLKVDGRIYTSKLLIVDTIPPKAEVHDITGYTLFQRKPEDFVTSIEDKTDVTVTFVDEPDFTLDGIQEVRLRFTDEGGNELVKLVNLNLEKDTESPVISGAKDMTVFVGATVSYRKNVTVTDNCPEGVQLFVDTSKVNLNQEGAYPVVYSAKDFAGNVTSQTITINVRPRVYDINEINVIADGILAGILSDGMTQMEKANAIFNYVKKHITYITHSEKGNYIRAAYEGLIDRKGDCYVYASTSKVLLTRAGIENMDIVKIPAKTNHYWNLVNVGDGWYHFDTTPRKDHPVIFMWTEAQMMDYSTRHSGSHNYDHTLYPEVN